MEDAPEELLPTLFDGDEVRVPISALEHYSYCPRQCALIHIEQVFEENLFTVRGRLAHEKIDVADREIAQGIRVERAMPLWSERFRLSGKADLVEFRPEAPYPVEYKVGRRVKRHADVQLCAQALCLEEMLGVPVEKGAVFYHALRRRHEISIDEPLRRMTLEATEAVRDMLREQRLPPAPDDARCPNCSLVNACLPSVVGEPTRLRGLRGSVFQVYDEEAGDA